MSPMGRNNALYIGTVNRNKLLQAIPKNKHISFGKQINYNIDYHGFNVTSQQKKTYRSYYYVTTICHISFYFYAITSTFAFLFSFFLFFPIANTAIIPLTTSILLTFFVFSILISSTYHHYIVRALTYVMISN